ncbi:DUF4234 domain-containing protein [Streptomyces sp. ODS28]|uniref:DUF4234 domain-containing protein n=1 Tax=Streptomyces sp. ODS28 TaxID=3136688 RepID=UPI0031EE81BF
MNGTAGKQRNIVLVWLVWPLITLGIYHLVWYYKINREARDFDSRIEASPGVSVIAITLGGFILVPPFVSVWKTAGRIAQMQRGAGLQPSCSSGVAFILMFVAGLHSLYLQHELNRVWEQYQNPAEGTQVPLAA